jgi:hypothetical protein
MSMKSRVLGLLPLALVLPLAGAALARQNPFAARPAKEHALLKRLAGRWKAEFTMTLPVAPPTTSLGTETDELLGDLWLVSRYDDPNMAGGAFAGAQLFGYDPDRKKYVAAWADTQTASLSLEEGTYDEATHTLTLVGAAKDPLSGGESSMRATMVWKDDDHRVQAMFVPGPGGKEMQLFSIGLRAREVGWRGSASAMLAA